MNALRWTLLLLIAGVSCSPQKQLPPFTPTQPHHPTPHDSSSIEPPGESGRLPLFPTGPHDLEIPIAPGETTQAKIWLGQKPQSWNRQAGVIFVTGVDGGFIEPVDGIYDRTASKLAARGVTSVFVSYRLPGEIDPSVEDTLAAAALLRNAGIKRMAVVGWSFGGAVISHSTLLIPEVITAVGFAPQARDTESVAFFTDQQSLLLFHSYADDNVPYESSEQIIAALPASVPREVHFYDDADHYLSGLSDTIDPIVEKWLIEKLAIQND